MPPRFSRLAARQLARPRGLLGGKAMDTLDRSNAGRIATCVEAAAPRKDATTADVGFGGGVGLRTLLDAGAGHVHGIELSSAARGRARKRFRTEIADGRLAVHEGTLQSMPLPDGTLDALISTNTVYFVPDLAPVATELARVLAPGGRAVLGIADSGRMREIGMPLHGFTLRPVDEIVEALTADGALRVVRRDQLDDIVDFTVLVLEPVT